jgi:hypothetical protein
MKISDSSGEGSDYVATSRYDDLARAYDVLLHQPVDIVVPVGAYIDEIAVSSGGATGSLNTGTDPFGNSRTNFAKQLADFCYQSTKEHNTALGVIGPRPILKVAADESWTDADTSDSGILFSTPTLANVSEWVSHLTQASGDDTDHISDDFMLDYLSGSQEESAGAISNVYKTAWQALESDGTLAVDNNGEFVDAGAYITVMAGPNRYSGQEAKRLAQKHGVTGVNAVNTNGAVGYGAKIAVLDPHIAATNQIVSGQVASRSASATQVRTLLRHRFVSYLNKTRGYVVTSAITGAHNATTFTRSDFVRVTTTRITHAVADVVREKGEPFIGKPISGPFLSALETQIEASLTRIRKTGALRDYDFNIQSSPDQQVLGEVQVFMTLVPAFELVEIQTIISLTKGEGIG